MEDLQLDSESDGTELENDDDQMVEQNGQSEVSLLE